MKVKHYKLFLFFWSLILINFSLTSGAAFNSAQAASEMRRFIPLMAKVASATTRSMIYTPSLFTLPKRQISHCGKLEECKAILRSMPEKLISSGMAAYDKQPAKMTGQYMLMKKILDQQEKNIKDKKKFEQFKEWLLGHYFYNRGRMFLDNINSSEKDPIVAYKYDKNGEYPFDGYLKAREEINKLGIADLNGENLQKLQYNLLSKESIREWRPGIHCNSENTSDENIGVIRNSDVIYYFNLAGESALNSRREGITLWSTNEVIKPMETVKERAERMIKTNQFISFHGYKTPSDYRFCRYLSIADYKRPAIKKLLSEKTIQAIEKNDPQAYQKMITEILGLTLKKLKTDLSKVQSQAQVIKAVAEFYHSFISIHPFINGNGRVARLVSEWVLNRYDLPTPIWTHFGEDVEMDVDGFEKMLTDSITLAKKYHQNLYVLGLEGISHKGLAEASIIVMNPELQTVLNKQKIIPEEFMTWFYELDGKEKINSVPEAINKFLVWKKELAYQDPYNMSAELTNGISLATPLFRETFCDLSHNEKEYQIKMDSFYKNEKDKEAYIHRGLRLSYEPAIEEILSHFIHPTGTTIGMGINSNITKEQLKAKLDQYNHTLTNDPKEFYDTVYEHTRGKDEKYWRSGFTSFSTRPEVANRFADGYLMGHEFMKNSKASIVVRAKNRLQAEAHSYYLTRKLGILSNYIAEKEVDIFAATDPEAIDEVTVDYYKYKVDNISDPKSKSGSTKKIVAKRIDYKTIEVEEITYEYNSGQDDKDKVTPDKGVEKSRSKRLFVIDGKNETISPI
ncbi:MAG: Fic family protein [Oligoflexia bacterium]|nr:Fic family protein [Oligoflexia bacterium]